MNQRYMEILEQQAKFDGNARVVLALMKRRAAGQSRQKTTAEIMADMQRVTNDETYS